MSKIIKLTQLGNIPVKRVKEGEDYDYVLFRSDGGYIAKRINSDTDRVSYVVYDWSDKHPYVGDTFTLTKDHTHWDRYRIADKSSPTIEDIKKHLQF